MRIKLLLAFAILPLLLGGLSGCSTATEKLQNREGKGVGPQSRIFVAGFTEVNEAVKVVMSKYPLLVENSETGLYETDYLKSLESYYIPPHKQGMKLSGGLRYRISIRVVKGNIDGQLAVRVQIIKNVEDRKDFFTDPTTLPSDGFEEDSILYRIQREIEIKRALKKLVKKKNKQMKEAL